MSNTPDAPPHQQSTLAHATGGAFGEHAHGNVLSAQEAALGGTPIPHQHSHADPSAHSNLEHASGGAFGHHGHGGVGPLQAALGGTSEHVHHHGDGKPGLMDKLVGKVDKLMGKHPEGEKEDTAKDAEGTVVV